MSFRAYPLFIKGNPQLRIFLPNFPMKMIKPKYEVPPNQVHFILPLEMTTHDCKNYLEKIYNVPVGEIYTKIVTGKLRKTVKEYIVKDPDYRLAIVNLPEGMTFKFPELFPTEKKEKKDDDQERLIKQADDLMKQRRKNWDRADVPPWFGL